MEWDNGATIGYRAAGDSYVNNNPSSSDVACLNSPESKYSNLIFLLSNESSEIPLPGTLIGYTITYLVMACSDIMAYKVLHY